MNTDKKTKTFLCIDAGTTRFKAAVIDSSGTIIAKTDYYYKDSIAGDYRLHYYDRRVFYEALRTTLEGIKKDYALKYISAIGITGHGQTLVPVGQDIIPIYQSIGFLDDRLHPYTKKVREKSPNDTISLMYIPIALFYKKELSSIYENIKAFLTPSDYLAFLLTEKIFTSVSSQTIEPWKIENLIKFGLDTGKFPKFIYMGQKIGDTKLRAKSLFGIPEGIPVFATGGDFAMGELGTGTIALGKAYLRFGTSAGINICSKSKIDDPRILSYRHFIKGLWNISAMINTAGISVDWAKKILKLDRMPDYQPQYLNSMIFFPYLKGEKTPFWNPVLTASLIDIRKNTKSSDILISILAGIAMGIREGIEIIEEHGIGFIRPIAVSGWWAGLEWFMRMISDITGKSYGSIQNNDAELLGVAIVLSSALNIYPDVKTAAKNIVKIIKIYSPDMNAGEFYNKIYKKYKTLRDKIYGIPYT